MPSRLLAELLGDNPETLPSAGAARCGPPLGAFLPAALTLIV